MFWKKKKPEAAHLQYLQALKDAKNLPDFNHQVVSTHHISCAEKNEFYITMTTRVTEQEADAARHNLCG